MRFAAHFHRCPHRVQDIALHHLHLRACETRCQMTATQVQMEVNTEERREARTSNQVRYLRRCSSLLILIMVSWTDQLSANIRATGNLLVVSRHANSALTRKRKTHTKA